MKVNFANSSSSANLVQARIYTFVTDTSLGSRAVSILSTFICKGKKINKCNYYELPQKLLLTKKIQIFFVIAFVFFKGKGNVLNLHWKHSVNG